MRLSFSIRICLLFVVTGIYNGAFCQSSEAVTLSSFRPVSIYKIPQTSIAKAKYPVIDFHSHDYPKTDAEVAVWVKRMDEMNIEKTLILTYSTGSRFDSLVDKYAPYKDRFEVWCGFDYTGHETPGWQKHALAELERCYQKGAKGVGELGDKGLGELYSMPTPGYGLHIDDPAMKPLLEKCAELHMPVSIHVAEDQWMYEKPDSTNDGLMNAATWKVDMNKPGILTHDQLVRTLENAVKNNPATTFIACHLANTNADLSMLGKLFDTYPNLYADIAARFGEFSPIPRYTKAFFEKHADRIVYGTDMGFDKSMYQTTFRILESADEHFYDHQLFSYHWALYGLSLNDATLKKIYSGNGRKILNHSKK
ncbi:MAG: amidohydrolase [Ferruginibacter sp.]|uniref:amidohydrolase family protein n=1 Tax=Ferruginibacter sp. TaxID=1940288 RepID=UPI002659FA3A|nr:amidohydrolase family protein [Ferruginibacter sp.]MDB5278554.1 amidohydrolase [Ferruginibacter sp.]